MLTHSRLLELFDYDPDSGVLLRKMKDGSTRVAGTTAKEEYGQLSIDNRQYMTHRVVWFYVNKEWPTAEIDHINRVKSDNRIENLRCLTRAENAQNKTHNRAHNETGFTGVFLRKNEQRNKKYVAEVKSGRKVLYRGYFERPEDAHLAWVENKKKFHRYYEHDHT